MDDDKNEFSLICKELANEVEEFIECPICYEIKDNVTQCTMGHHICKECTQKVSNCPICNSSFTLAKNYMIEGLSKALIKTRLCITAFEGDATTTVMKSREYKKVIQTLLTKLSLYLSKESDTMVYLRNYLKKPTQHENEKLQKEISSLTDNIENIRFFMDDIKETLSGLKKE